MKKTKIMSMISALLMVGSSVFPFTTNAVDTVENERDSSINWSFFDGYTKVEPEDFDIDVLWKYGAYSFGVDDEVVFARKILDNGNIEYRKITQAPKVLEVDVYYRQYDKVMEILQNMNGQFNIEPHDFKGMGYYNIKIAAVDEVGNPRNFTFDEANNIYYALLDAGEEMLKYKPHTPLYKTLLIRTDLFIEPSIEQYITENEIVATCEYSQSSNRYIVTLNGDLTGEERAKAYVELHTANYDDAYWCMKSLDVDPDYVKGDSNEDGKLTVADSVIVLQYVGNPDKYSLTSQGEFNADVDGENGLTANDAYVIQQMELGIK